MFKAILQRFKAKKEYQKILAERFYNEEFFINGYRASYEFDIMTGGSLCIYDGNEEIAKADMHFNYPNAELHKLYVDEEYRLKGIATAMIRKIIEWCNNHNITRIKVHPYAEHSRELFDKGLTKGLPQELLIDFYKKCGFTEEIDDYLYTNIG
ncbi:MAG: GNAT family N-acetyltransferase [Clostridiales bacterium]|nr:GNAT family N-acetyltransferase [Clostridiales bacterium]